MKSEPIGPPSLYLGGHLRQVKIDDSTYAWAFSSTQYVQAAVANVKSFLAFEIVSLQATLPDCGLLIISVCLPLLTPIGKKISE